MTILRYEVVAVVECDACPKGWHYESTNVEVEPVEHWEDYEESGNCETFATTPDKADYWKPVNR